MGKSQVQIQKEVKGLVNQNQLDTVFAAYMEKEYQDNQIGDLQDDEGVNPQIEAPGGQLAEEEYFDYGELSDGDFEVQPEGEKQPMSQADMLEFKMQQDKETINEAVDEFIQDKKLWFRDLHKTHGEDIQKSAI